ncbi:MAG: 2Fe-2S iron-sulfur cluster-binding protein, partial [Pseudomonadota bacterium]|nr:2Fe-2S iron-sulfur cluster-binding protein [Pseudomonadota bacterium]
MTDTVTFELDGEPVTAAADETLWQVAQRHGTEIPHLCYRPADSYRPDGNCRACMVEIEGERTLAASCVRRPRDGMVVHTQSESARTARRQPQPLRAQRPTPRAIAASLLRATPTTVVKASTSIPAQSV